MMSVKFGEIMNAMVEDEDEVQQIEMSEFDDNEIFDDIAENEEHFWNAYDLLRQQSEQNGGSICFRNLDFTRFALALASVSMGSPLEWRNLESISLRHFDRNVKRYDHVVFTGKDRGFSSPGSAKEKEPDGKS